MAYWSSNSDDSSNTTEQEKITKIEDSGTDDSGTSDSYIIDFTPIDRTDQLLKEMRKRWWNFVGRILHTSGENTETTSTDNPTFKGGIVGPAFTGLRFVLGGDKQTH